MAAEDISRVVRWTTWLNAWVCLSLPGLCAAALIWGPVQVLGIATAVAIPIALVFVTMRHGYEQWEGLTPSTTRGLLGRLVVGGPAFAISTAIVSAFTPGIAILIVAAAAISTPSAGDAARQMLASRSGSRAAASRGHRVTASPTSHPMLSGPLDEVHQMSDTELCVAWRYTFWALRETADPARKLAVVRMRQCFLDEFEARDASALRAWLASDARPSTIPQGFMRGKDGDHPTEA